MHTAVKGEDVSFPIIGESLELINLYDSLSLLKWHLESYNEGSHVLITGETGVGKENVALLIGDFYDKHLEGSKKPGVKLTGFPGAINPATFGKCNCAGISEELAISLLFGHVKGAATGLDANKIGLIHEHAVVVFLDEIQELKGRASALLLRFMQDGTYHVLGDATERHSSCKIIGATNRKNYIKKHSKTGLIQRFTKIINIPALNVRREDIPALVQYFYEQYFSNIKAKPAILRHIKQEYLSGWENKDWTDNNIRTLRKEVINIIETYMRDADLKINKVIKDYELRQRKAGAPKKTNVISYIKCLIDKDPKDLNEFKDFWMENRIERSYTFDALRKAISTMKNKSIESDEPAMVEDMINYFQEKNINDWLGTLKTIMDRFDKKALKKYIDECNEL